MKNKKNSRKKSTSKTRKASTKKPKSAVEESIIGSSHMLEMVINSVPQHIFWKDINSVFLGCNHNFARTVGLESPEDIVGKTDFDITNTDKANHFIEIDNKVISSNKPIYGMQERHKKDNGEEVWINVNKVPLSDNNGKVIGVLGTFEDVTDKFLLSKKLSKNAQKYQSLIERTNTAYMILDEKLRIIDANTILSELLGITNEDIVGRSPREWINNGDIFKFDKAFDDLFDGKSINDLELSFIRDRNASIRVSISANIIENGSIRIFCLLRDISKKVMEEEKRYIDHQKKKDKLKQNIIEIREQLRGLRKG